MDGDSTKLNPGALQAVYKPHSQFKHLSDSSGTDCRLSPEKLFTPFHHPEQGLQEPSMFLLAHMCELPLSFRNRDFNLEGKLSFRGICHVVVLYY